MRDNARRDHAHSPAHRLSGRKHAGGAVHRASVRFLDSRVAVYDVRSSRRPRTRMWAANFSAFSRRSAGATGFAVEHLRAHRAVRVQGPIRARSAHVHRLAPLSTIMPSSAPTRSNSCPSSLRLASMRAELRIADRRQIDDDVRRTGRILLRQDRGDGPTARIEPLSGAPSR